MTIAVPFVDYLYGDERVRAFLNKYNPKLLRCLEIVELFDEAQGMATTYAATHLEEHLGEVSYFVQDHREDLVMVFFKPFSEKEMVRLRIAKKRAAYSRQLEKNREYADRVKKENGERYRRRLAKQKVWARARRRALQGGAL